MRERSLLYLFLALNRLLAAAFGIYLFLSTHAQPKIMPASLPAATNKSAKVTNSAPPVTKAPAVAAVAPAPTDATLPAAAAVLPTPATRTFGWQDVENPEYLKYIANLRLVGCPNEKIQQIIVSDINELIDQKRLKEAVSHDTPWWKVEPNQYVMVNVMQEKGRALEEERRALIEKLVGPGAIDEEKSEALLWNVQLTGPVLGALPAKTHNTVQEICQRSVERSQSYQWGRFNEGQPINQVEMAKLREQTRADLRQILSPDQVEEFTLRYSHNAHQLRMELAGMDPTPEEFRKIFRAIDPGDHQMQLEFGSVEAMSPKQRERYERQRDAAIKDVLSPARYA